MSNIFPLPSLTHYDGLLLGHFLVLYCELIYDGTLPVGVLRDLGWRYMLVSFTRTYLGTFWCISAYKSVWVLTSGLEISGEAFSPPAELVLGPCFLQSASDRQNVFYVTSFSGCDPLSVLDWCQVCCCVSLSLFASKSCSPFPPIPRPSLLLCEEIL